MTTTPRTRRHLRALTTLSVTIVISLSLGSVAQAQSSGCRGGYDTLEDKLEGRVRTCPEPHLDRPYQRSSLLGAFVDVLDLGNLELRFEGAEIEAVEGAQLAPMATDVVGGVTLGAGGRLHRWVRLPEVSITLGGASFRGGSWVPLGSQYTGLEARPTSLFLLRLEVALGVEAPFRHVRPYLLARGAASLFLVGADVRDRRLGALGHEVLTDGAVELGSEVGLAFLLSDQLALNIGWRATWLGATGHGVTIALTGARSLR